MPTYDRSMATCLPGYNDEEPADFATAAVAAAADTVYTVPAGVVNGVYWVRVTRDANGNERAVRISAKQSGGVATVNTKHQSSNEERVALGPLQAFDLISYWRDCGAGIIIEVTRIS